MEGAVRPHSITDRPGRSADYRTVGLPGQSHGTVLEWPRCFCSVSLTPALGQSCSVPPTSLFSVLSRRTGERQQLWDSHLPRGTDTITAGAGTSTGER